MLPFVLLVIGCAQSLPTYPAVDAGEAIRLMAERSQRVKTISSRCRFILTRPDGRSIELEGALAAKPPDYFRFRGWKVSQPVFDLTIRPDGLWRYVAERPGSDGESDISLQKALDQLTPQRFAQAWAVLGGEFDPQDWKVVADERKVLRLSLSSDAAPGRMLCEVSRPELTLRRCELRDSESDERMTLHLDRYRSIQGVLWPTRISFQSPRGSIALLLDHPVFNDELPAAAFEPPPRAVRKP